VDEHGKPLPGAPVIFNDDSNPGFAVAQTDKLGQFQLTLFPRQKYFWESERKLSKEIVTVQVGTGQDLDLGDLAERPHDPRSIMPVRRPRGPR
jgi:hypothetical protein